MKLIKVYNKCNEMFLSLLCNDYSWRNMVFFKEEYENCIIYFILEYNIKNI